MPPDIDEHRAEPAPPGRCDECRKRLALEEAARGSEQLLGAEVRLQDLCVQVGYEERVGCECEQVLVASALRVDLRMRLSELVVLPNELFLDDAKLVDAAPQSSQCRKQSVRIRRTPVEPRQHRLELARELVDAERRRHAGSTSSMNRIAPCIAPALWSGEQLTLYGKDRPRRFVAVTLISLDAPPSLRAFSSGLRSSSTGRPMSRFIRCSPCTSSRRNPHSSCAQGFHAVIRSWSSTTMTPASMLARMLSRKSFVRLSSSVRWLSSSLIVSSSSLVDCSSSFIVSSSSLVDCSSSFVVSCSSLVDWSSSLVVSSSSTVDWSSSLVVSSSSLVDCSSSSAVCSSWRAR